MVYLTLARPQLKQIEEKIVEKHQQRIGEINWQQVYQQDRFQSLRSSNTLTSNTLTPILNIFGYSSPEEQQENVFYRPLGGLYCFSHQYFQPNWDRYSTGFPLRLFEEDTYTHQYGSIFNSLQRYYSLFRDFEWERIKDEIINIKDEQINFKKITDKITNRNNKMSNGLTITQINRLDKLTNKGKNRKTEKRQNQYQSNTFKIPFKNNIVRKR